MRRYVKEYPAARKNDPCAVCGQSVLGSPIYWHGYGWFDRQNSGATTHQGCYWDADKLGEGPHLTWEQVEGLRGALVAKDLPDDPKVRRVLDAVNVALADKQHCSRTRPVDVALLLGPDLVDGYGMIAVRLRSPGPFWALKFADGTTDWQDPRDPANQPKTPTPISREEYYRRRDERYRAAAQAKLEADKKRVAAGLASQFHADVIMGADNPPVPGWQVRGSAVIPCEIVGYSPDGRNAYVRPTGSTLAPTPLWASRVFDRLDDAKADAQKWLSSQAAR